MPSHAVTLDEKHFRLAEEKARSLGTTPEEYVRRLIDTDALADQPFDQLLGPIREGFEGLSDEQLEELIDAARMRGSPTI